MDTPVFREAFVVWSDVSQEKLAAGVYFEIDEQVHANRWYQTVFLIVEAL